MPDLSVLVAARNEIFLDQTVADVVKNRRADTEVIAVLDGYWPHEPLPDRKDVVLIHLTDSIGQRAAVNLAARTSRARYLMKLDAHCAVDEGFDVKLIDAAKELGDDCVQIPAQYNLHAFDWVCACGARQYQGPTPTSCAACGDPRWTRDLIWKPRLRRLTTAWRFDTEPKFQYWPEAQRRQQGDLCDVMTSLGACWFMRRRLFAKLGMMDEAAGSWGSFGIEIACKAWLSGGRHVVNRKTWFAHMFRTQGGDFGFPYPLSGKSQDQARQRARELWFGNAWPGQVRPLSWVIEHFAPVPDWHEPSGAARLAEVMAAGERFARRKVAA